MITIKWGRGEQAYRDIMMRLEKEEKIKVKKRGKK